MMCNYRFMYFLGLTIDIVSCTTIIISVGLCVDFRFVIILPLYYANLLGECKCQN